jgi:hypothetical protein
MVLYKFSVIIYYDNYNQCYKNVICIDKNPDGPLKNYVRQERLEKISPFNVSNPCNPYKNCRFLIFRDNDCKCGPLLAEDADWLFDFLISNGYTINTSITNMVNKSSFRFNEQLLCFAEYK